MSSSQLWTPPQISAHRIRRMIDSKLRAAHTGSCRSAERQVQQRARLQRLQIPESRNAGPVCCNGWFGLNIYDVPFCVLSRKFLGQRALCFFLGYANTWPNADTPTG